MTPMEWMLGENAGTSSKTICAVMTGSKLEGLRADVPHDPSDFGRCHQLLTLFPHWRGRLAEVSHHYMEWSGLVREWDDLTAIYQAEIADGTGKAPRLYKRMQALIDEGRVAAGWTQTSRQAAGKARASREKSKSAAAL